MDRASRPPHLAGGRSRDSTYGPAAVSSYGHRPGGPCRVRDTRSIPRGKPVRVVPRVPVRRGLAVASPSYACRSASVNDLPPPGPRHGTSRPQGFRQQGSRQRGWPDKGQHPQVTGWRGFSCFEFYARPLSVGRPRLKRSQGIRFASRRAWTGPFRTGAATCGGEGRGRAGFVRGDAASADRRAVQPPDRLVGVVRHGTSTRTRAALGTPGSPISHHPDRRHPPVAFESGADFRSDASKGRLP